MAESDRKQLLERAFALPTASATDFVEGRKLPTGVEADLVKKIDDTSLRSRLIAMGLAEGLQSPKGRQKIASLLRIYPGFDAPPTPARVPRGPRAASTSGSTRTSRAQMPTVEEMERLISRIRHEEAAIAKEMHVNVDREIRDLQTSFGSLDHSDLEDAHRKLGAALNKKRDLTGNVRREAFARIAGDGSFSARHFLKLLRDRPLLEQLSLI